MTGLAAAPATGPGDTSSLFPTAINSSWNYGAQETTSPGVSSFGVVNVAVTGTTTVGGVAASRFTFTSTLADFNGFSQFYFVSPGGVTFYGNDVASDLVTNRTSPVPELTFPVSTGPISNVVATGLPFGTAGADPLTVDLTTQQINVGSTEQVVVDAGVFPDAVKVTTTISGTVTDTVSKQTAALSSSDVSWYAPGVGLVKETLAGSFGTATTSETLSARGYTVGGVTHGLGTVNVLASNVAPPVGFGKSASSGVNTLVSSGVPNFTFGSVGRLIGTDGSLAATIPFIAPNPPFLTFDGVNYVAAEYATNTVDSKVELNLQRISTTGAAVDTATGLFVPSPVDTRQANPIGLGGGNHQTLALFSAPDAQNVPDKLLLGMLISSDGVPSDPQGFTIHAANHPTAAAIAFDGSNYLVVWQDGDSSSTIATQIFAVRVSQTGAVLDAAPIALASGTSNATNPAIAFDGASYLVAWSDAAGRTDGQHSVVARRFATTSVLLESAPLTLSAPNAGLPTVGFNGTEFLVAWLGASGIKGARLNTSGIVTSGAGFEIQISNLPTSVSYPLTITSGPSLLFTWLDATAGFTLVTLLVHPF